MKIILQQLREDKKLHPHFPPYKNILLVYCWLEVVKACDKMCQDSGF